VTAHPPRLAEFSETLAKHLAANPDAGDLAEVRDWIEGLRAAETTHDRPGGGSAPEFRRYLFDDFRKVLAAQGITSGRVCEIGGPYNSLGEEMPEFEFTYLSLYPDPKFDNVELADIAQADYIEGGQFDAVFSSSVFEHVVKPWNAAAQVSRLLKPGGVAYHAAPFSYFYHGAPTDYWRFTPDAFEVLFSDLRTIKAEFFGDDRRRDNRGSEANPVDKDGGEPFAVDPFGGWRENWFTVYAGIKDQEYADGLLEQARLQAIVNLMKTMVKAGVPVEQASVIVRRKLRRARINRDQEIEKCEPEESSFPELTVREVRRTWWQRGKLGIRPTFNRFVMARRLDLPVPLLPNSAPDATESLLIPRDQR